MVGNTAIADDILQEAWLRALEKPPAHAASLAGWWSRVARNLAIDWFRREGKFNRHKDPTQPDSVDAKVDPSFEASRAETSYLLLQAVRNLTEPYRTAVTLHYIDGLAVSEVGSPNRCADVHRAYPIDAWAPAIGGRAGPEPWISMARRPAGHLPRDRSIFTSSCPRDRICHPSQGRGRHCFGVARGLRNGGGCCIHPARGSRSHLDLDFRAKTFRWDRRRQPNCRTRSNHCCNFGSGRGSG
ncbi:MAG: RNA polymerase sigma factor [Planctomycetes bacterium]|nr:RNA polymerase sigma factor [Planctomycetota bacterium]